MEQEIKQPLTHSNGVIVIILLILVIAGSGAAYYFYTKQTKALKKEIAELTQERTELKKEKNDAQNQGIEMVAWLDVTKKALFSTIDNLDQMDKILLEDDKKARSIIGWMRDNGKFTISDGTLATANVKLESWDEFMAQNDKDYKTLKSKMDDDLETLNKQLTTLTSKNKVIQTQ